MAIEKVKKCLVKQIVDVEIVHYNGNILTVFYFIICLK